MTGGGLRATALLGLAGLAAFSLLFSLAAERGLWPGLPPGLLHDSDLASGLAAGVFLLLLLVVRRNRRACE